MNTLKDQAFRFIDEHKEEMLTLWQELVNMESGSQHKPGIDAVAAKIQHVLENEGAVTKIIEMENAGNMLVGEIKTTQSIPPVLFMGHMDTVFSLGTVSQRPFTIKDGTAYGPGVLDMKGGIVAAIYAMKSLHAAGYNTRPLKMILAGDEEIAHAKSNAADVFMAESNGAVAAFNCETGFTDDAIVVGRKGTALFELEVKGVAVHAGNEPENGRSAILEIAHKVIAIQKSDELGNRLHFQCRRNSGRVRFPTPCLVRQKSSSMSGIWIPPYCPIFENNCMKSPPKLMCRIRQPRN